MPAKRDDYDAYTVYLPKEASRLLRIRASQGREKPSRIIARLACESLGTGLPKHRKPGPRTKRPLPPSPAQEATPNGHV